MSLFSPREPGQGVPADRPATKLTVRLPKALPEARVVALHGSYGDEVRQGAAVMTLRVGEDRHVLNAPRAGRLLPLVGPGDELRAGDALFALHFEPEGSAPAAPLPEVPAGKSDPFPAIPGRGEPPRPRRTVPASPRGRHVPVLGEPGSGPKPKPKPRATARPPAPEAEADRLRDRVAPARPKRRELTLKPAPAAAAGGVVRLAAALALLAGGMLVVLPLAAELAFGGPEGARLVVTIAALALGLLAWRLLSRGAGPLVRLGVGLTGAAWTALVILTMTGTNPVPLGPVSLPDTHALAPASRIRVPPARPAAAPPAAFSGIRSESAAGAPGPRLAAPEGAIRYSALPTERFALVPPPDAPPAVAAGRARMQAVTPPDPAPAPTASERPAPPRSAAMPAAPALPPALAEAPAAGGAPPRPVVGRAAAVPTAPSAAPPPHWGGALLPALLGDPVRLDGDLSAAETPAATPAHPLRPRTGAVASTLAAVPAAGAAPEPAAAPTPPPRLGAAPDRPSAGVPGLPPAAPPDPPAQPRG